MVERLRLVGQDERAPAPDGNLEFLDDSAAVNTSGLREELHEEPAD